MTMENRFDTAAKEWDERPIPNKVADAFARYLHEHDLFNAGDRILDYGCGSGILLLQLTDLGYHLEGMDNSAGMLDKVREKVVSQKIANVELTQHHGDEEELPVAQYEGIVSSMVLHHIEQTNPFLQKCFSALKEGGVLCIADLDKEDGDFHSMKSDDIKHFGFEREILEHLLIDIGFRHVGFHTLLEIERNGKTYPIFILKAEK